MEKKPELESVTIFHQDITSIQQYLVLLNPENIFFVLNALYKKEKLYQKLLKSIFFFAFPKYLQRGNTGV